MTTPDQPAAVTLPEPMHPDDLAQLVADLEAEGVKLEAAMYAKLAEWQAWRAAQREMPDETR